VILMSSLTSAGNLGIEWTSRSRVRDGDHLTPALAFDIRAFQLVAHGIELAVEIDRSSGQMQSADADQSAARSD